MFSWSNVEVGQEIDGGRDSPPLLPSPGRDLRLLFQSVFGRESASSNASTPRVRALAARDSRHGPGRAAVQCRESRARRTHEFARSAGRAARTKPTTPDCQTQRCTCNQRTAKLSFTLSKFRLLWQTAWFTGRFRSPFPVRAVEIRLAVKFKIAVVRRRVVERLDNLAAFVAAGADAKRERTVVVFAGTITKILVFFAAIFSSDCTT